MAKFTSFDAPRGTAGPISVRRASADDFGGDGKSLQIAGAALADFGKVIKEREDKRSITSARAQFSEFQLQFEQEQAQRQQDAPIGSTGHFDASKSAFDDSYNKI